MTLTTRQRWLAYAGAGLLTLLAMLWVDRRDEATAVALPVVRHGSTTPPRPALRATTGQPDPAGRLDALLARAVTLPAADPFAASGPTAAQALAAAATAAAAASRPTRSVAPAPASLPPLPFSFLGRWTERGQTTVYLQRDNRSVSVQAPGRLDDEYSVESIDEHGIVFNHLPSRQLQTLRFEARADDPAARRAAAPPTGRAQATRPADGDTPAPSESEN